MKKLFALAFMSVAAVSSITPAASAWWPCFPMFDCCKSSKCCTTICLRQYNAFTPVCSGTLNCDGCCPLNLTSGCLQSGPACFGIGGATGACYGPYMGSSIYAAEAYPMGQLPPAAVLRQPMMHGPALGMPAAPAAPMPAPAGATSAAPQMLPFATPVQNVGYRPAYYGIAPYYWNNAR